MILVKNVKKFYDNGLITALNGISFEIGKGEIIAVGLNGLMENAIRTLHAKQRV